jgi:predicted Rossmann fold flavoprotein
MHVDESRFITDSSPNTLRRIVRAWPLAEQRSFFSHEVGIPLVDEPDVSKVFPASHKARDVRDGLLRLGERNGTRLRMNARVVGVSNAGSTWITACESGESITSDTLILACGGLSVPNTGSDGAGLEFARMLGHTIHQPYVALTPLLNRAGLLSSLAGISLPVTLQARSATRCATASGGFLFTQGGYSGPSVLDVSHVLVRSRMGGKPPAELLVNRTGLDDAAWAARLVPHGARTVTGALRAELPERLVSALLEIANVDPARSLAELQREERIRLIDTLVRGELPCTGNEGYRKAEVTGGGVSLAEINSGTMERRRHSGLFLCGEMLDAFGPIGGYNFLWAWATGRAAGIGATATP